MKINFYSNTAEVYFSDSNRKRFNRSEIKLLDIIGTDFFFNSGKGTIVKMPYADITTINGIAPSSFENAISLLNEAIIISDGSSESGDSYLVGKPSGGNFVTSYNGATSLDCDGMPAIHSVLIDEDIMSVVQINNSQEVVMTFTRDEYAMVVTNPAGTTYRVTIAEAVFATTDTFVVYTNISTDSGTTVVLGTDTYTEAISKASVIGVVRNDAGNSLVDTDGEFTSLQVNSNGMLNTNLDNINDSAIDIGSGNLGTGTQRIAIATDDINLAAINVDATTIAGDTTSLDAKIPSLGTAIMTASLPVTLATDDTLTVAANAILTTIDTDTGAMVTDLAAIELLNTDIKTAVEAGTVDLAAIEVLNTTIAGDTTSIDGKTSTLGTGIMTGSSPVTLATDDTQYGAVGAASDVDGNVHGQLRYIGEAVDGLDAGLVAPTVFRSTAVDETAGVVVKAAAGNLYGWNLYNPNTYDVFVKFYDTAQASVVVGTTAIVQTIQVPSLGSVVIKEHSSIQAFSTAITVAATKLVADNDTTAITSDVFTHIYYK